MDQEDKAGEQRWDGVCRREVACELRVLDQDERSVEVIASTEALDSHGDVLRQHWDLSRYEKNGPVLWNHNLFESSPYSFGGACRPEDLLPVGKGVDVRVEGKRLLAKLVLIKGTPEQEPLADKLWRRIQQGVVKAVSVGFKPGQVTRILNASGGTDHFELGSPERPNELREISFVPMGSNPEAVAKSIAFERRHLETLAEPNTDPGRPTATPALGGKDSKKMDEELKKALEARALAEKALSDEKSAREKADKEASEQRARAEKAESALATEKTVNEKLNGDLDKANKATAELNAKLAKTELDALQGVKFAPAEREELDKLVESVGLDRVKSLLAKRTDMAITQPVIAGEQKVSGGELPPAPVEGSDPSGELLGLANKAIN